MSVEIELKLQLDPRHVARLCRHPLLRRAKHGASHKLYSVYYDTPDLDLWRAGIALRLRRVGAPASSKQGLAVREARTRLRDATARPNVGASRIPAPVPPSGGARWVQTIKSGGGAIAGLHQRNECEAEVATQFPDFSVIDDQELAAHFASPELRARLKPVIVTEFTRTSSMLAPAEGVVIEASIDHGIIKSGDATEPICELELEVKAGSAWRAYQVALQLLEAAPFMVEDRSKAERGMALHKRAPRKPRKTPRSPVAAGMTSNEAFKALVWSCLVHYIANQRGMLEGYDPEYLHQMRVALRRLRSMFSTFSPLFPAAALESPVLETRWLAQMLGPARDWDVFNTGILQPVTARYARHAGIAALARSAARLRQAANNRARRAAASARGQGLLLALGGWLSAETWLDAAPASSKRGPAEHGARTRLRDATARPAAGAPSIPAPCASPESDPKANPLPPCDARRLRDARVREAGAAPSSAGATSASTVASRKSGSLLRVTPAPAPPSAGAQGGELQRPVTDFARAVLDAALRRALKRGRHFARLAPRELHRLRIAAKKLRYAAEFFAPLYDGDKTRDYRAALARLQNALGAYNDAVTVTRLAARASRGLKGASANEARGIMLGWSAGMQEAGTRHVKRIWKEFRNTRPFWE